MWPIYPEVTSAGWQGQKGRGQHALGTTLCITDQHPRPPPHGRNPMGEPPTRQRTEAQGGKPLTKVTVGSSELGLIPSLSGALANTTGMGRGPASILLL